MYEDDVLREVWRVKDMLGRKYGYNIARLAKLFRKYQLARPRKSPANRGIRHPRKSVATATT